VQFPAPLVPGTLLRREKRFFAYVRLDDGREVVAHTTNTGRMTGCSAPGSRVWLSPADRPERKLKWTWELVEVAPGVKLGVNTVLTNRVAEEAILDGTIGALSGYATLRREVRYGQERSRIDLLLQDDARPDCWIEVKSATLLAAAGRAEFPDAPTERGRKHLRELASMVRAGDRAVLLFVVLRGDAEVVAPADSVDPEYGAELRRAAAAGVELMAWRGEVTVEGIALVKALPVELEPAGG
jgi:sugar fermentation stimulation protein A